jgi:hypothetical protein
LDKAAAGSASAAAGGVSAENVVEIRDGAAAFEKIIKVIFFQKKTNKTQST